MESIKNFKSPNCCLCQTSFIINGYSVANTFKTPFTLKCGHSSCEKCLQSELESKNEVCCNICKTVTATPTQFDLNDLSRVFPVNYFLVGLWQYKTNRVNAFDLDASVKYVKPKNNRKKRNKHKSIRCNECVDNVADTFCKQCNAPYCTSCFKVVHLAARAFRSHMKVPLVDKVLNIDKPLMCTNHTENKLEFYCLLCRSSICTRCMIETHNGHTVDILDDVEADCQEEFIEHYIKVSQVLGQMKSTKKKIENLIQDNKDNTATTNINHSVYDFFIQIHGKLSVLQNEMHMKLGLADTTQHLESLLEILNEAANSTETLLISTKHMIADVEHQKAGRYICAIENFKVKEKLPCYLLESHSQVPPRFVVDEDVLQKIDDLSTIELSSGDKFKLVTDKELPAGYEISPVPELTREDVLALMSPSIGSADSSSVTSERNSERALSPTVSNSDDKPHVYVSKEKTVFTDDLSIGCHLQVRISHMVSPSNFYVQRECAPRKLYDFQCTLRTSFLNTTSAPSNFSKGKIYLSLYERDSKWYRARILEILNNTLKVLYIDFGNTEYVTHEKLRELPKNALNIPVLAYRCRLSGVVPRNGGEWDPESFSFIAEIIDNDPVTMVIIDKTPIAYVVDLYRITPNYIVNIQHALLFQEYASLAKEQEVSHAATNIIQIKSVLTQLPIQNIQPKDILEVHVSHVSSPHDFHVQNMLSSKRLIKMSEELQKVYNIRNLTKYAIYDPIKGMYIVARYSKDLRWYRGQILDCLEGKVIRVSFIDFGNEEDVKWNNVKLLQPKFRTLAPQAIKCVLCDVLPIENQDEWSDEACDFFYKTVFDKKLKLVVESVMPNYTNVVLYSSQPDADICINAIIVREKLAISIGVHSTVAEFPKVYSKPPNLDLFQCEVGVEKTKKEKQIFEAPVIDKSTFLASLVKAPNGTLRIHIFVKRIVSPGEFYVTPSCFMSTLTLLEAGLQKFYERSRECEEKEWEVDDKCAIKHEGKWYRAIVLELLDNSKLKVSLPDEGFELCVEKKWTRPLHVKFTCVNDGVTRCHLGGLEPAQEKWSSLSKTEFDDFVNNYRDSIFMCQMGEIQNSISLPVELFGRITKEVGPTEPNSDEWRSLNHFLRVIGHAKSDKMVQWDSDGNILNWSELDKSKEGSESEETVMSNLFSSSLKFPVDSKDDKDLESDNMVEATNSQIETVSLSLKAPEISSIVIPSAWLPPLPLKKYSFVASPTYVDSDCTIYLHDFHQSCSILEEISTALSTKYDKTLPKPCDATLQPGDICIAQYHLDKKWHRAILLNINQEFDQYEIQFVDYGNVEHCKLSDLRKIPVCHNIPIQALKCRFHKLVPVDPSGKWETRHIEIIQYEIVDKNCHIKLVKLPNSDIYGIKKLKLPDGRDFIAEIVSMGFARYKQKLVIKPSNLYNINDEKMKSEVDDQLKVKSDDESEQNDSSENNGENVKIDGENEPNLFSGNICEGEEREDVSEANNTSLSTDESEPEDESLVNETDSSSIVDRKIELVNAEDLFKTSIATHKPKLLHWTNLLKAVETLPDHLKPSLQYKELKIPPLVDTLIVEASAYLSPTELILHLEDVEDDPILVEKLSEFKELSKTMQKEAPVQPLLSEPYKYKPCCGQFSADNMWYRAIVLDELPYGMLLIQFVDYGNVEAQPLSSVRELKDEWASLEVQGLHCILDKISVDEDTSVTDAMKSLLKIMNRVESLKAVVKERNPLKVDLYFGDNLAYEELIDSCLFRQH